MKNYIAAIALLLCALSHPAAATEDAEARCARFEGEDQSECLIKGDHANKTRTRQIGQARQTVR